MRARSQQRMHGGGGLGSDARILNRVRVEPSRAALADAPLDNSPNVIGAGSAEGLFKLRNRGATTWMALEKIYHRN